MNSFTERTPAFPASLPPTSTSTSAALAPDMAKGKDTHGSSCADWVVGGEPGFSLQLPCLLCQQPLPHLLLNSLDRSAPCLWGPPFSGTS